tara:strand:+ start:2264 stop:2698 length:435 start_codon:yes stop_codon:yes gene_type:complete
MTFAVFLIILFFKHVTSPWIFALMVVAATILPDLDSGFSSFGRHLIFRPLQLLTKHRGIIHSFSFAILVSIILAIFWPVLSLGFFVGYSVHLILDSFTKDGIQPFWPFRMRSSGFITSGGRIEDTLFFTLIILDIVLFFGVFVL